MQGPTHDCPPNTSWDNPPSIFVSCTKSAPCQLKSVSSILLGTIDEIPPRLQKVCYSCLSFTATECSILTFIISFQLSLLHPTIRFSTISIRKFNTTRSLFEEPNGRPKSVAHMHLPYISTSLLAL